MPYGFLFFEIGRIRIPRIILSKKIIIPLKSWFKPSKKVRKQGFSSSMNWSTLLPTKPILLYSYIKCRRINLHRRGRHKTYYFESSLVLIDISMQALLIYFIPFKTFSRLQATWDGSKGMWNIWWLLLCTVELKTLGLVVGEGPWLIVSVHCVTPFYIQTDLTLNTFRTDRNKRYRYNNIPSRLRMTYGPSWFLKIIRRALDDIKLWSINYNFRTFYVFKYVFIYPVLKKLMFCNVP